MCLHNVDLNLKWNSALRAYIGIGYKKLKTTELYKYSRIGRWTKATGDRKKKNSLLHKKLILADDTIDYHPGFHIFLERNDARNYQLNSGDVYEVIYKNVISFGTNEVNLCNLGPCVVTEYMKIVRKLD